MRGRQAPAAAERSVDARAVRQGRASRAARIRDEPADLDDDCADCIQQLQMSRKRIPVTLERPANLCLPFRRRMP